MTAIRTIRRRESHSIRDLSHHDVPGEVLAADFYLIGAELWEERPWGLRHPVASVTNVDLSGLVDLADSAMEGPHRGFQLGVSCHVAKLWLDPVAVAHAGSFRAWELRRIQQTVEEHRTALLEKWNENFGVPGSEPATFASRPRR